VRSKKVLYISASIGLGHVNKDLAIANELRKQNPGAEVKWLACVGKKGSKVAARCQTVWVLHPFR
jgi:UDP-N-acetylglucosamine:LPS N-acetylglucosamine transferase